MKMKTKDIYTCLPNAKTSARKDFIQVLELLIFEPRVEIAKINVVQGTCQTFTRIFFKLPSTKLNKRIEKDAKNALPETNGQIVKYVCPRYSGIAMCQKCEPKPATLAQIAARNNIAE
jgi:hypothetical protein